MTDDSELDRLKRQRLAEMQKRMTAKQQSQSHTPPGKLDPSKVFEKVFVGRAWEVYYDAGTVSGNSGSDFPRTGRTRSIWSSKGTDNGGTVVWVASPNRPRRSLGH